MRLKSLLILLVLVTASGCKDDGYVRPDPELCQPMITFIHATLTDGTVVEAVDPNSYWFCVRRSEPYNQAYHRRPKFRDYLDDAAPTAVSADDLSKLNQSEKDAEKYIEELEAKCRK